jgi:hypothetical protein
MCDKCSPRGLVLGVLLVALLACEDDPTNPDLEMAPALQPLTAPENLISNIEILYNDSVRTATERKTEYEKLLAPPSGCDTCQAFLFDFQPTDELIGIPDTWGRDPEIEANANIFHAQANGQIHEMTLNIEFLAAQDLGDPGRPGWKEVFATNVHLRLLTTPQDGFEILGAQARFRAYSAQGRWWIGEWIDLPRPGPRGSPSAVGARTWGRIKYLYH